jgi:hypothetical protein
MNFLFLSFGGSHFRHLSLAPSQILINLQQLGRFSASGGTVVFAAFAFCLATTSWALALFGAPSVVPAALLDLRFLEVSAGSNPMLPGGCIFLPDVGGIGRGE